MNDVKALKMPESGIEELLNNWNLRIAKARDEAYKNFLSKVSGKLDQTVAKIEVHYSGSYDIGSIDDIRFFSKKGEEITVADEEIHEAVKEFACDQLDAHYFGWNADDGSQGKMIIDVNNAKASFEHEWNVMTTEEEDKDVSY